MWYPEVMVMAKSGKKKLTEEQEFEIMKLVLDKFLWIGFVIMAFGLYLMVNSAETLTKGFSYMVVGAIVLVLFLLIIVKEYEIIK